jgi:hypothetical protein
MDMDIDMYLSFHESLHGCVPTDVITVNTNKQNTIAASQLGNVINSQPHL